MSTLLTILKQAEQFLKQKGITNALFNAEVLFSCALGCDRIDLYLRHNSALKEEQLKVIRALLTRRAHREPLQYIVGEWPFYELILSLDHRVLIPRPETEFMVEWAIKYFREKRFYNPQVLDLGTGSGAIALSIAKEFPRSKVIAADKSPDALQLASENAKRNKLRNITFVQSTWYSSINGTFDLIISNPPYLSENEWQNVEPEIKNFEPKIALVADNEGIADLIEIIKGAPKFLKPDGILLLETGQSQHDNLLKFANENFDVSQSQKDQFGKDRFLIFQQPISDL